MTGGDRADDLRARPMSKKTGRVILVGSGVLVVGLVVFFAQLPIAAWATSLAGWMRHAGAGGIVVFAFAYVAATLLLLPGSSPTAAAGFAYGPVLGLLLVSPVSVVAATAAFAVGRNVAREWVARRVAAHPRLAAIDDAIGAGRRDFQIVMLLRLSPILPFNLLNYALGLTRVRPRDYILGSFVGMIPGTFLYVYLGSAVTDLASLHAPRHRGGAWESVAYWGAGRHRHRDHRHHALVATVAPERGSAAAGPPAPRFDRGGRVTSHPIAQFVAGRAGGAGNVPDDDANRELALNVRPPDWVNPTPSGRYNLVVVGAGTAGLVRRRPGRVLAGRSRW